MLTTPPLSADSVRDQDKVPQPVDVDILQKWALAGRKTALADKHLTDQTLCGKQQLTLAVRKR